MSNESRANVELAYATPVSAGPGMFAVVRWLQVINIAWGIIFLAMSVLAAFKARFVTSGGRWSVNFTVDAAHAEWTPVIALAIIFAAAVFCAIALWRKRYRRTVRILSLVTTLLMPIGSLVGIMTFIVLGRSAVKVWYR